MTNKKESIPFFIGYLLLIAGAVLHIINNEFSVYIFGAGVAINLIFRLLMLPRQLDKRIRRLNNQQLIVAVLLVITCYLMWIETEKTAYKSYWVITLIISAVIDLWLSFRYPNEEEKS